MKDNQSAKLPAQSDHFLWARYELLQHDVKVTEVI